jgi:hypothetical protein
VFPKPNLNLFKFIDLSFSQGKGKFMNGIHNTYIQEDFREIKPLMIQYLKECKFLKNYSERTIRSYEKDIFPRWLNIIGDKMPAPDNLIDFVIGLRV